MKTKSSCTFAWLLLLASVSLFSPQFVHAQSSRTFYLDAIAGDDGANGLSEQTAWKTLGKLQSAALASGDRILFKRGQVFAGAIRAKTSGVTYSAYGSGDNPVISGLTAISQWTSLGAGVYEANCKSCNGSLNLVVIDQKIIPMGRFPNFNTANGGYLTIDSHIGTSSFTDAAIAGTTSWKGAEAVIRKTNWLLDRSPVTQHSGSTITYITPTGYAPIDGYGYFMQNHPATLDMDNEWYYDPSKKKFRIYRGSTPPPAGVVKVSTVDTLVNISGGQNISFDNLTFEGSDTAAIRINGAKNIRITNCSVIFSGTDGISVQNTDNIIVDNVKVNYTNNDAIVCYGTTNSVIQNSVFKNTGLIPGMGLSNNQNYEAVFLSGDNNVIQNNIVDSTGYSAITFHGNRFLVKNNYITNYTMTVDDGGGIYTWADSTRTDRKVIGNIVLNGLGAVAGTTLSVAASSNGIYFDDRSSGIEVADNTVANANNAGLYLHNAHEINFHDNTFYNNKCQVLLGHDNLEPNDPIRNVEAANNILFSKEASQTVQAFSSVKNDIALFGKFNHNYYARPLDTNGILNATYLENGNKFIQYHNINSWSRVYGFDAASQPGFSLATYRLKAVKGANLFSNGNFLTNTNGIFCLSSPGNCSVTWNASSPLDGSAIQVAYASGELNKDLGLYMNLGSVKANKDYIIKFSSKGLSKVAKTAEGFLLRSNQPYQNHTASKMFTISNNRTEHEYLYRPPVDEDLTFALGFLKADTAFWVDNVQVLEADIAITNIDDSLRFYYNETANTKTISLDQNYADLKGNQYNGRVTLLPFTSVILVRVAGAVAVRKNQVPVAKAGTDLSITPAETPAKLNGSLSFDADGKIVSYKWRFLDGPTQYILKSDDASVAEVSNLTPGVYKFQLQVTDDSSATAVDTVLVVVKDTVVVKNLAPVALAGSDVSVTSAVSSVQLDASGSTDADGNISSYRWEYVSGPAGVAIAEPSRSITTVTGLVSGIYIFKLTVTDNFGASASDELTVNVRQNAAPVANAGQDITISQTSGRANLSAESSTDADGRIIKYRWTRVSGPSPVTIENPAAVMLAVDALEKGVYVFRVTVTDNDGLTDTDDIRVTVTNLPPVALAGPDVRVLPTSSSVTLNGSMSRDEDGSIVSYRWKVISGPAKYSLPVKTTAAVTFSKFVKGTYVLRLTVKDNGGLSAFDDVKVIVAGAVSTFELTELPGPALATVTVQNTGVTGNVKLSPNPVTNSLTLIKSTAVTIRKIWIVNTSGRVMIEKTIDAGKIQHNTVVDLSGLTRGMYYLKFLDAAGVTGSLPFVKM